MVPQARSRAVIFASVCGATFVAAVIGNGRGDISHAADIPTPKLTAPGKSIDVSGQRSDDPHRFLGVSRGACANCHSSEQGSVRPVAAGALPAFLGRYTGGLSNDRWIRADELIIWGANDKHTQAFTVLLNERSQKMGEILGVVDKDGKSQIHRDVRCLTCHVGMPADQMLSESKAAPKEDTIPGHEWLVSADLTNDPRVTVGVSCESCHGSSGPVLDGEQEGWVGIHVSKDAWRYKTAAEKESKFGYWDVRSPVSKTRICLSCHLGNVEEGKVVTHEMYAAGHPPLPGFEAATFIHQEPRHWREFEEKTEEVREEFRQKAQDNKEYISPELNRTQDALVGAVAGLAEYMKLNADLASTQTDCPVPKPEWPELANFACYACHHDLQERGWRLLREPVGTPGRPRLHEWPTALTDVALKFAGADLKEYQRRMQAVEQVVDRQPFGEAAKIQRAARELSDWLFQQAQAMEKKDITPADAQKVLAEIARKGAEEKLDYDATRQLAWAAGIIYDELHPPTKTEEAENNRYKLVAVPGWYKSVTDLDETQELLAQFDKVFLLDLRKGRDAEVRVVGEETDRPVLEVDLNLSLPPIGDYTPQDAAKMFRELQNRVQSLKTETGS